MTSETTYTGELRTYSRHVRSGVEIITDAPVDNHGKGQAFSPTDLTATSLANCMLTVMAIRAKKMELQLDGTKAVVTKFMASNPRRIKALDIEITFPSIELDSVQKNILEKVALNCPVALSLHPEIEQRVKFIYL